MIAHAVSESFAPHFLGETRVYKMDRAILTLNAFEVLPADNRSISNAGRAGWAIWKRAHPPDSSRPLFLIRQRPSKT
ncbi:MAG TPA: hypothetical protein PKI28_09490 [Accumulibacter sp.]|nr:hypothetical protein [Accumulibacter sp.]HNI72736.1 hypothetical protein [Accumulibacter sp.]HNL14309.1 hypothetical protein [Accumulibacter sp.]HNO57892.1 hypothetical protein [Accumulibacter sp.]